MLQGDCGIIPHVSCRKTGNRSIKGMRSTGQLYQSVSAAEAAWVFPRPPQPSHAWRRHVRDSLGHTSRLDRTRTRRRLFVPARGWQSGNGNKGNYSNEEKCEVFDCRGGMLYRSWLVGRAIGATLLLQVLRTQDNISEQSNVVALPASSKRSWQRPPRALRGRRERELCLQILRAKVYLNRVAHLIQVPATSEWSAKWPPRSRVVTYVWKV